MMSPRLRIWLKRLALVAGALVAALVVWVVVSINSDRPVDYADIQEHFKYGSIGSEPGGSLLSPVGGVLPPYWVFTALPSVCRDKLPDGYATFGFVTVILGATDKRAHPAAAGLAIGLALTLIHLVSIPVTNTSVNPARSTAPALFVGGAALSQLWLFWVAPLVGGAIAGLGYGLLARKD